MPAVQELLINVFVATSTISCSQLCGDHESMMVFFILACSRLMAIKTIHTLPGVHTHFVFMHDRILSPRMAFGALASSTHQVCAGLFGFGFWPGTIDQERGQYQTKGNDYGHENRPKRHSKPPCATIQQYTA